MTYRVYWKRITSNYDKYVILINNIALFFFNSLLGYLLVS